MFFFKVYRGGTSIQAGGLPLEIQVQDGRPLPLDPRLCPLGPGHLQHGQELRRSCPEILITRPQDVYSIIYTNQTSQYSNHTVSVEVFKCSEDTSADGHPWRGRAVSIYQLVSLFIIPAVITVFFYQAVIRVLWKSTK